MHIALLEGDQDQARTVQDWLQSAGEDCTTFDSADALVEALRRERFDVLVVDRRLPGTSGDRIVEWARQHVDWHMPVLVTEEPDAEHDWSQIVQLGADDYLRKPLERDKTVARITALAGRAQPREGTVEFAPFEVDYGQREIRLGGRAPELTRKEFELAAFLFEHHGETIHRGEILQRVWHRRPDLNTRTVDTHISRIRHKLRLDGRSGWQLRSIYQRGYRLTRSEMLESRSGERQQSA